MLSLTFLSTPNVSQGMSNSNGVVYETQKKKFYLLFNLMVLGNSEMVLLRSFFISPWLTKTTKAFFQKSKHIAHKIHKKFNYNVS